MQREEENAEKQDDEKQIDSTVEGPEELTKGLEDEESSDEESPPMNLSDIFAKEYEKRYTHQEEKKSQEKPQVIQDKKDQDVELRASPRWDHPDTEIFGLPTPAHLLDDAKEHWHQRLGHQSPKTLAIEEDIKRTMDIF